MQSQMATDSATQQAAQQPWSPQSLDTAPSGVIANSTPSGGGQPPSSARMPLLEPSHSSTQVMPRRTQVSSSISPPFRIQPDVTQTIGFRGAQQGNNNVPFESSSTAQNGGSTSPLSPQFSSPWAAAEATSQAPSQTAQHNNILPESQSLSRSEHPEANRQAVDGLVDDRQTSPRSSLARARQQQSFFTLRNGHFPILTSVPSHLPYIESPSSDAFQTQPVTAQLGAPNSSSESLLPQNVPGDTIATAAASAQRQTSYPVANMPTGQTTSPQQTGLGTNTTAPQRTINSHVNSLPGLAQQPSISSSLGTPVHFPEHVFDLSHIPVQRLAQHPGTLETGVVNPFSRRSSVSSPGTPSSPTPFPSWIGSFGSNPDGHQQQQNDGGSGIDNN